MNNRSIKPVAHPAVPVKGLLASTFPCDVVASLKKKKKKRKSINQTSRSPCGTGML
jgi:hypothetical protein